MRRRKQQRMQPKTLEKMRRIKLQRSSPKKRETRQRTKLQRLQPTHLVKNQRKTSKGVWLHRGEQCLALELEKQLAKMQRKKAAENAAHKTGEDATGEDAAPKTSAESFKAAEQTYIEKYRIDALERQRQRWQFEQRSWSSYGARRTYSDW